MGKDELSTWLKKFASMTEQYADDAFMNYYATSGDWPVSCTFTFLDSELLGTGQEIAKVTLQKATLEAREPLKQKTWIGLFVS